MMIKSNKSLGVYIHIPFCQKKCYYCDFLSFDCFGEEEYLAYASALEKEIVLTGKRFSDYKVDTLFIGGGTPSVFSLPLMDKIARALYKSFSINQEAEFTIEANPKILNYEKLKGYKDLGINRISLGVQSLEQETLERIGRIHDEIDVYHHYNEARRAGFDNINLDIMFSVPNQSMEGLMGTLHKISDLRPEHISYYSLIIEENTQLYAMKKAHLIDEMDEDTDREMYWRGIELLKANGYDHYEISNLALKNKECQHNLKYWSLEDYVGLGLGAHSFAKGQRWSNETNLQLYIEKAKESRSQIVWQHENTGNDNISEYMFTGLRKKHGIDLTDFNNRFHISLFSIFEKEIEKCEKQGLLYREKNRLMLTDKGIDVSNTVMSEFILD